MPLVDLGSTPFPCHWTIELLFSRYLFVEAINISVKMQPVKFANATPVSRPSRVVRWGQSIRTAIWRFGSCIAIHLVETVLLICDAQHGMLEYPSSIFLEQAMCTAVYRHGVVSVCQWLEYTLKDLNYFFGMPASSSSPSLGSSRTVGPGPGFVCSTYLHSMHGSGKGVCVCACVSESNSVASDSDREHAKRAVRHRRKIVPNGARLRFTPHRGFDRLWKRAGWCR